MGALDTREFPKTRYRGSKVRHLALLEGVFAKIRFESALDLFGGTGAVSWLLKRLGKRVHFNDALPSSHVAGVALVVNDRVRLEVDPARALFERVAGVAYDDVVARVFDDVFFPPNENEWIDVVAQNALRLTDPFERSLALWALFQACLQKRPFNLFHRKNLDLRTRDVARTFGNKATWERPFPDLFLGALAEANAAVFANDHEHRATCLEAHACPVDDIDLVYLDPPYVRADGAAFDYADGYHFLDGLLDYPTWSERIDRTKKHLPLGRSRSPFVDAKRIEAELRSIFERAAHAHLVISYRDDGVPSIDSMVRVLEGYGRRVSVVRAEPRAYALSHQRSAEAVVVARR